MKLNLNLLFSNKVAAQQSVHWTGGIRRHFRAFFPGLARQGRLASSFSCSQAESTPAPAPLPRQITPGLTQTVGQAK